VCEPKRPLDEKSFAVRSAMRELCRYGCQDPLAAEGAARVNVTADTAHILFGFGDQSVRYVGSSKKLGWSLLESLHYYTVINDEGDHRCR